MEDDVVGGASVLPRILLAFGALWRGAQRDGALHVLVSVPAFGALGYPGVFVDGHFAINTNQYVKSLPPLLVGKLKWSSRLKLLKWWSKEVFRCCTS